MQCKDVIISEKYATWLTVIEWIFVYTISASLRALRHHMETLM
jgi:hypothetical protein